MRKKIRKIDEKMAQKIQELQDLMSEGGMDDTALKLNQCLPDYFRSNQGEGLFLNENANAVKNGSQSPKSLETIYISAVPQ